MKIGVSNDSQAVKAQYSTASSLDFRINFHNKYSTNKQGYSNWIVSQYDFKDGAKVLEIGCGTGDIWFGRN